MRPKRFAQNKIKIGSRVKHSKLGLRTLNPKNPERLGKVLGFSRRSAEFVRVVWDGTRSAQTYHIEFIEKEEK